MAGAFSNSRKAFKLDELGFVGRGRSRHRPRNDPSLYNGPYPFFQTGDIGAANLYLHQYAQTYNETGLRQSRLWMPETLCITIAASIAETAILQITGCFPDSVVGFVADPKKADVHFIKYYIDTIKLRMQGASHGTTQDNLSLDKLLGFDFVVPDVDEQRRVSSVLAGYDYLIENNTRRIAILEKIARSLYHEWFVEFRFPEHKKVRMVESEVGPIPRGWGASKLKELADVNARSIRRGPEPDTVAYVDIASVSTGSIDAIQRMLFSEAPGRARRLVHDGDTIWSCVRPNRRSFSIVLDPDPELVVSTGFAVLTPKAVPFAYLYYCVTTEDFTSYLTNHAQGAAYPAVTASTFEKAVILKPEETILDKFQDAVGPLLRLQENLRRKNLNLRSTRDLLLPRLISGEVDVSAIETSVPVGISA